MNLFKVIVLIFFLLIIASIGNSVFCRTIHVPGDYPFIQEGINNAIDGDTVLVADGIFKGINNKNIDFVGKIITVMSENGPEKTIIDCENNGRGFYFGKGETNDSKLAGFKVINGKAIGSSGGGGIFFCNNASPTISNCILRKNSSLSHGGAIDIYYAYPVIINCALSANVSYQYGGGINVSHGKVKVSECKILNNVAEYDGGGINIFDGSAQLISGSTISGNICGQTGGGIEMIAGLITDCIISSNSSGFRGGGIGSCGTNLKIINCIITSNSSVYGAGVFSLYTEFQFINSFIVKNFTASKGEGGGVSINKAKAHFEFSTIADNIASLSGGLDAYDSSISIRNSIFWGNIPDQIRTNSENIDISYTDIYGGWQGQGNVDKNPHFVNENDYHLLPDSPCIDTGIDSGIYFDIDENIRPQITGFDIGADEVTPEGKWLIVDPCKLYITTFYQEPIDFDTLQIINLGTSTCKYKTEHGSEPWLILSGETNGVLEQGDSAIVIVEYNIYETIPGEYKDLIKVISNDPWHHEIKIQVVLKVFSQHMIPVPWIYNTIQEGINAANNGDTVIVDEGVYTGKDNRNLDFAGKKIVVMSEHGPDFTIIDCENVGRGFYFHSGESDDSKLTGFTIQNGYDSYEGGAIYCYNSSPCIENCKISLCNTGLYGYGGGIFSRSSNPLITDCLISNNSSTYGGGIRLVYSLAVIRNCVITNNLSSHNGLGGGIRCTHSNAIIENCTFAKNIADDGGGIYCDNSSPEIKNCILWHDFPEEISSNFGNPNITFSDIENGWPGIGNISIDPKYVFELRNDYRLLWGSPCIDSGDPSDMDPDNTRSDMGAHFYDQLKTLVIYLSPQYLSMKHGDSGSVSLTVSNSHNMSQYYWRITNITLPDGNPWAGNPLEGPFFEYIPAESNIQKDNLFTVPSRWYIGKSTFTTLIGLHKEQFDKDYFVCEIDYNLKSPFHIKNQEPLIKSHNFFPAHKNQSKNAGN